MARSIHKLTAMQVAKAARKRLTMADGGGLYLQRGAAWVFRYARNGRTRYLGLGALEIINLRAAREAAQANRRLLHAGEDPLVHARARRAAGALAATSSMIFDDCCAAYLVAHQDSWRSPKHRQQWKNTLAAYAAPVIGKLPVAAIDTALVLRVLEPIWKTKPETASGCADGSSACWAGRR